MKKIITLIIITLFIAVPSFCVTTADYSSVSYTFDATITTGVKTIKIPYQTTFTNAVIVFNDAGKFLQVRAEKNSIKANQYVGDPNTDGTLGTPTLVSNFSAWVWLAASNAVKVNTLKVSDEQNAVVIRNTNATKETVTISLSN